MSHLVTVDINMRKPTKIQVGDRTWLVKGECHRCGRCCATTYPKAYPDWDNGKGGCKHLYYETVDGKKTAKCDIPECKPWTCFLYPFNPLQPNHIIEGCGFSFEEVET